MKEIKATAATWEDIKRLELENERLTKVNRSLYSSALTVASELHRLRCQLEYKCNAFELDYINNKIRLQAITLAEHAKKQIGDLKDE